MPFLSKFCARFFICLVLGLAATATSGAEFYQWTDEQGTIHFSDSLGSVPPQYRDQVRAKSFRGEKENDPGAEDTAEDSEPGDPEEELQAGAGRYEVPYIARDAVGALRIIIPVTFNDSVTAPMALDTGAPGMIISTGLAERIGIFGRDEAKLIVITGGIGGAVPAIRTIIDKVRVQDVEDRFVPTTVTGSLSGSFEGLMGMDFMANHSIFIDTNKKVVVFEAISPASDMPGGHNEQWWRTSFEEFAAYRAKWKEFSKLTDRQLREATTGTGTIRGNEKELKAFSEQQYEAASELFDKLNRYASEHSVPMHWREF
jgi:hypothetical protein